MWTLQLLELGCAEPKCQKLAQVILKWSNQDGYVMREVYCRKHGQAHRDGLKADFESKKIQYQDLT
jgi:hypothetical protein